jgi:hypothetical protein
MTSPGIMVCLRNSAGTITVAPQYSQWIVVSWPSISNGALQDGQFKVFAIVSSLNDDPFNQNYNLKGLIYR